MNLAILETTFFRRAAIVCTAPFITLFLLAMSLLEGLVVGYLAFKDYMSEFKANIIREWDQ